MVSGSKTLNPVTVVADVAKKIASVQEIGSVVAKGNFSRSAPIRISRKKLPDINNGGEIFNFFLTKTNTTNTSFNMKQIGEKCEMSKTSDSDKVKITLNIQFCQLLN